MSLWLLIEGLVVGLAMMLPTTNAWILLYKMFALLAVALRYGEIRARRLGVLR